jgi:hypothetical protein
MPDVENPDGLTRLFHFEEYAVNVSGLAKGQASDRTPDPLGFASERAAVRKPLQRV